MVFPLLPLLLGANLGMGAVSFGANAYQQVNNKKIYAMNRAGYERKLSDWYKNVGSQGRTIKYPEHSFQGNIRSLSSSIDNANLSILGGASGFGSSGFSQLKKWV